MVAAIRPMPNRMLFQDKTVDEIFIFLVDIVGLSYFVAAADERVKPQATQRRRSQAGKKQCT